LAEHRDRYLACCRQPYIEAANRARPELITALNRHQEKFGPAIGIWNYTVGDADYQVAFSHHDANEIN